MTLLFVCLFFASVSSNFNNKFLIVKRLLANFVCFVSLFVSISFVEGIEQGVAS